MSTPPDHLGGERSPIAATVPSPNRFTFGCDQASRSSLNQLRPKPICDARQKRLASKAAYRARHSLDPKIPRGASAKGPKNGVANAPRRREPKGKRRAKENYHRPLVAIDAEGQNYPGADVVYDGVRYPRHDSYLWGAAADNGHYPSGYLGRAQAVSTSDRSMQLRSWTGC